MVQYPRFFSNWEIHIPLGLIKAPTKRGKMLFSKQYNQLSDIANLNKVLSPFDWLADGFHHWKYHHKLSRTKSPYCKQNTVSQENAIKLSIKVKLKQKLFFSTFLNKLYSKQMQQKFVFTFKFLSLQFLFCYFLFIQVLLYHKNTTYKSHPKCLPNN